MGHYYAVVLHCCMYMYIQQEVHVHRLGSVGSHAYTCTCTTELVMVFVDIVCLYDIHKHWAYEYHVNIHV